MFFFFQVELIENHCCPHSGPFTHNARLFCLLSRGQFRTVFEPLPLMRRPDLPSVGEKVWATALLSLVSLSVPPSPSSSPLVPVPAPVQSLIVEPSEQLKQSSLEKSSPPPHLPLYLSISPPHHPHLPLRPGWKSKGPGG